MKKTIAKTALFILASALSAEAAESGVESIFAKDSLRECAKRISVSATADYESEFVFRGKQLAGPVISPEIDISFDIGAGFGAYAGWWGCYSTNGFGYKENDLYAGVAYSANNLSIDFGYTAYTYPDSGSQKESEIKLILSYDTSDLLGDFAVSPFVAGYYNFTYEGKVIEFGLSYSAPISKWIISENWAAIDISAFGGAADYKGGMSDGGYVYAGATADLALAISDNWKLSIGIRYATNDNGSYGAVGGREQNFWYGVKTSIGF